MPIFREYCLDFLIARDLAATYSCESLVDLASSAAVAT